MIARLPEGVIELLRGKNIAHIATVMKDGSPQVTPVWIDFDHDNDLILINMAEERVKPRNMRRDPRVALSISDEDDPFHMASIRGTVVEITRDGAEEHIDGLAKKYLGVDRYPWRRAGERRLIVRIRAESVYP